MGKQYVLGVDFGTTGTKSIVFDIEGNPVGEGSVETPLSFPRPGYAVIDPDIFTERTYQATKTAIEKSGINPNDIVGVSFSNLCAGLVPIDKEGNYLYPIIPWNDTRSIEMFDCVRKCMADDGITDLDDFKRTGYSLQSITGLPKMLWLQKKEPEVYHKTYKFGNCQAVLTKAYTGKHFVDDQNCITFSKLSDCRTLQYIPELCDRYGVDYEKLADVKPTSTFVGEVPSNVAMQTGLAEGTPVYMGAGDVMCATVGAGVSEDGVAAVVIGTGGNVNTYSSKPMFHPEGKFALHGSPAGGWHLMGSLSAAASSLTWFTDTFCQLEKAYAKLTGQSVYPLITAMAEKSPVGARGCMYNAWLAGADCPYFNGNARGTFTGLTFSHTKNDIARSVLEGVSYDLHNIIEVCQEALQLRFHLLRILGGAAKSSFWTQMQADVNNMPVETVECEETSALGAALFAAVGAKVFSSIPEGIKHMVKIKRRFEPNPETFEPYKKMYELYKLTYEDMSKRIFPAQADFQYSYVK